MTQIVNLKQIKEICRKIDFAPLIEEGFAAYSDGRVVVPPVGEMSFSAPPGDTHIKYGYIKDDDSFVVKIASGFYDNPKRGLPSNSGLMLVFSQHTGLLQTVLLDEGYLTDVRTAVAGRIAAKYLASSELEAIGILGTGIQARLQVLQLRTLTRCRQLVAWGRSEKSLEAYRDALEQEGFSVVTTTEAEELTAVCNLIVTATPSAIPLLFADQIRPGTHITAVGSDTPLKQELDPDILAKADLVVADSIPQCLERGEIAKAIGAGTLNRDQVVELGKIVSGRVQGRTAKDQITVADLTGVAVQDIQIAKAVCAGLENED
ncbi:MAG: ornithine cyclodeaminase family protein [Desulfofustis sp.]|nr:ornithine cyclodeaminase family protein [Desulfofustis sp.]NNK56319.1 ornithine cyclodeaminase family protein [Desulfofustis sp.]